VADFSVEHQRFMLEHQLPLVDRIFTSTENASFSRKSHEAN